MVAYLPSQVQDPELNHPVPKKKEYQPTAFSCWLVVKIKYTQGLQPGRCGPPSLQKRQENQGQSEILSRSLSIKIHIKL
jgi:hypothetical protein